MHGLIFPAWTHVIIVVAGAATILAFRNIRHKVRLGYIAMGQLSATWPGTYDIGLISTPTLRRQS